MRECIFCGQSKVTAEHAWPAWVSGCFPSGRFQLSGYQVEGDLLEWHSVNDPGLRVKCACAECNNGWMSQLEVRTQPILEPMIRGEGTLLSQSDQQTVSLWAVKSAMVFEFTGNPDRQQYYRASDRKALSQHEAIPEVSCVWLAHYLGSKSLLSVGTRIEAEIAATREPAEALVTTLEVGALVLQTFSFRVVEKQLSADASCLDVETASGPWQAATVCVWPTDHSDLNWPPRLALSEDDPSLTGFAHRFRLDAVV